MNNSLIAGNKTSLHYLNTIIFHPPLLSYTIIGRFTCLFPCRYNSGMEETNKKTPKHLDVYGIVCIFAK